MSVTDHAFIRAYTQLKAGPRPTATAADGSAPSSQASVIVGPQRVDGLDAWGASPHFLASAWTSAPDTEAAVAPPRPMSAAAPAVEPPPETTEAAARVYRFRPDAATVQAVPPPHAPLNLFTQAVAGSIRAAAIAPPAARDEDRGRQPVAGHAAAASAEPAAQQVARVIQAVDRVAAAVWPPESPCAGDRAAETLGDDAGAARPATDALFLPEDAEWAPRSDDSRRPPPRAAIPLWKPQWEVDDFSWPAVCLELSRLSAEPFSSSLKSLADRFADGQNIIAVTSGVRGAGVSTIALCLARIAARLPLKVALLDGHLQHPVLGPWLGLDASISWHDLPLWADPGEAAVQAMASDVCLMPARLGLPRPTAERCAAILEAVAENFELVVLDAGSVDTAAHDWFSTPLASRMHGMLVRDTRQPPGWPPSAILDQLTEAGLTQLAVVENFRATGCG